MRTRGICFSLSLNVAKHYDLQFHVPVKDIISFFFRAE
jgi:hypothetical protein